MVVLGGGAVSYERGTPVQGPSGKSRATERNAVRDSLKWTEVRAFCLTWVDRSHLQTLVIYKLGYDKDYYTLILILLTKIVLCSKFP